MNGKSDSAADVFRSGFNCAQAVFAAHAAGFGISEHDAFRIACGFGGGMGRLQETCGAVTGAFMLIGCRYGMTVKDDAAAKEKTYACVRQFVDRFIEKNRSISCKTLLGCDLRSDEGKKYFKEHGLQEAVCVKCVRDAVSIVEQVLFDESG
jgi:C_GCAxxG_C_C family probable redox protein